MPLPAYPLLTCYYHSAACLPPAYLLLPFCYCLPPAYLLLPLLLPSRVAFGSGPQLQLTALERAHLDGSPMLVDLIEWILTRDPAKRPGLTQIQGRVEGMLARL